MARDDNLVIELTSAVYHWAATLNLKYDPIVFHHTNLSTVGIGLPRDNRWSSRRGNFVKRHTESTTREGVSMQPVWSAGFLTDSFVFCSLINKRVESAWRGSVCSQDKMLCWIRCGAVIALYQIGGEANWPTNSSVTGFIHTNSDWK